MRTRTLAFTLTLLVLAAVGTLVTLKAFSRTPQTVNSPQSRLGIYGVMGFVISEVDPNSTAAQAGLKPGDIITGLNGQLTGVHEFQRAIWSSAPGTTFEIEYLRFNPATGKTEENKVTLKTMAFTARAPSTQRNVQVSASEASHGLDCPEGCCDVCRGFSPNKYCIRQGGYFTGFRNCTTDGFSCRGLYCA